MPTRFNHELLARARVDLGMTQEQAAREVGVDVRTYRRYESGEVNAGGGFAIHRASRRDIVRRMARDLGLDEAELLTADDAPSADRGHALPRAKHFVGRGAELAELDRWLATTSGVRVVCVVGLGGSGKTSLVEHAMRAASRPAFAWSFYDDPRTDAFFDALLESFAADTSGTRGDQIERLARALATANNPFIVLDGLEVMQSSGDTGRARGELEDSRMRIFLRRVARGVGETRALVTSRLSLSDLDGFDGAEVRTLALGPLSESEGTELLRAWGMKGAASHLAPILRSTGLHALTLAVVGSYVGGFLDGDPARFGGLDLDEATRDDALARRLAKILEQYAARLDPSERDLLSRVATFPRGASLDALARIAEQGGRAAGALAGKPRRAIELGLTRLSRAGLLSLDAQRGRYTSHPFVRQTFQALLGTDRVAVHEAERARLAATLATRPDIAPGPAALDDIEALFDHTLLADRVEDAAALYFRTLHGFENLGLRLGELARGLRIVRAFGAPPHGDGGDDARSLTRALSPSRRSRLSYEWGLYAAALGDLPRAVRSYEANLEIAIASNDEHSRLTSQRTLAYTHRLRGEVGIALGLVDESIEIARRGDVLEGLLRGLCLRGALLTDRGDLDGAMACFEQARALGDLPVARRALWEAECWLARDRADRAAELTEQNVVVCSRLGWEGHLAQCHILLGWIALRGPADLGAARAWHAAASSWCGRSGEVESVLRSLSLEAALLAAEGRAHEATTINAQALELAELGGFTLRAVVPRS